MAIRSFAAAIAAAVSICAFAPSTAGAVGLYNGNAGVIYLDWMSMEVCNAFAAGTRPARVNGEAFLVIDGKRMPVAIATRTTAEAVQEIVARKPADKAAFQKAVQAAYASGSKKVDDATATALSQQFKARIEADKR